MKIIQPGTGWALLNKKGSIVHSAPRKDNLIRNCLDPITRKSITKKSGKGYKEGDFIVYPYLKRWVSGGTQIEKMEYETYELKQINVKIG